MPPMRDAPGRPATVIPTGFDVDVTGSAGHATNAGASVPRAIMAAGHASRWGYQALWEYLPLESRVCGPCLPSWRSMRSISSSYRCSVEVRHSFLNAGST